MEKMFKVHWWDYKKDAFNINGRVCLRNAIAFGALGVIVTRVLDPWYFSLVNKFSYQLLLITSIIVLIITLIDIIISFNAMNSIKDIITKDFIKKDATKDIKKLVNEYLLNYNFLQKRLIKTYHLLDKEKEYIMKTIKVVNEKTKSGYGLFIIFITLGLIIGLILSLVLKLDKPSVIIPFTLTISSLIAAIILKVGDK